MLDKTAAGPRHLVGESREKIRPFSARFLIAAPLLAAALLTGCSSEGSGGAEGNSSAGPQAAEPVKAQTVDDQAISKVDQLLQPTESMFRAQEELIRQCMAEKGFDYRVGTYVRDSVRRPELTVEAAHASGYDSVTSLDQEVGREAAQAEPGYQEALGGTEDSDVVTEDGLGGSVRQDGCLAEAYDQLYGSVEAGMVYVGGLLNYPVPYQNAANLDQEMEAAADQWSACMKDDYGIDVAGPDLIGSSDGPERTPETAVKDATCREKTGYEQTYTHLLNAYLTTFLEENQGLITQMGDARTTAEQRAPGVLNGR